MLNKDKFLKGSMSYLMTTSSWWSKEQKKMINLSNKIGNSKTNWKDKTKIKSIKKFKSIIYDFIIFFFVFLNLEIEKQIVEMFFSMISNHWNRKTSHLLIIEVK